MPPPPPQDSLTLFITLIYFCVRASMHMPWHSCGESEHNFRSGLGARTPVIISGLAEVGGP